MALVLDTGVVYSAIYADDPDHDACAELISESEEQLILPAPTLVEIDYWIRKSASVEVWLTFCEEIAAGAYTVFPLDPDLTFRAAQLQARFSDQAIGFVDAAVFASCEVLGEEKVATLDRRHFSVLTTAAGRHLQVLP